MEVRWELWLACAVLANTDAAFAVAGVDGCSGDVASEAWHVADDRAFEEAQLHVDDSRKTGEHDTRRSPYGPASAVKPEVVGDPEGRGWSSDVECECARQVASQPGEGCPCEDEACRLALEEKQRGCYV